MSLRILKGGAILLLVMLLAACGQTSVDVGDVPATQYRHVWITVQEIRLHPDSSAKITDTGWQSVTLPTPVSIDLLQLGNGNLSRALERQVAAGTYEQVRLFLVDPGAALTASANSAGLSFNDQVEFTDSQGNSAVRALELVAPNDGIRINGSVETKRSSSLSSSTVSKIALLFDSRHDVIRFDYGGGFPGFLLNPRVQAADLTKVGAISGQIDLSAVAPSDALVQAETLSSDGTYHVVAGATPIASDGHFLLYPLPLPADSTSATYDLVITGTGATTTIIQNIPVSASASSNTLNATQVQPSAIALTSVTSFAVNVDGNNPLSPTAATVRFYQTLPDTSSPYEIAARTANPFAGTFFDDVALATGPVNLGTYNGGADITLAAATPQEGAGSYQAIAEQAGYARRAASAALSQTSAPASGTLAFTIPELGIDSSATELTLSGTITTSRPGSFDSGFLMLARDGRVITTMPLGDFLVQSGLTYAIGNVPGGSLRNEFTAGVYSLYARVWNSADPERTVTRISFPSTVDLSAGNPASVNLTLP